MKEWEPDDGHIRCITVTTIVRFEYSGDGMKAAETEIATTVDMIPKLRYSEIINELIPSHLDYHVIQRRIMNA